MNENENALSQRQLDAAKRMGRVAGLIMLVQTQQPSKVPAWVMTCLQRVMEACGPGGGQAVADLSGGSPYMVGFGMGTVGLLASFIRNPDESWGQSPRPWFDAYFSSMFSTIGVLPPPTFWHDFKQTIFDLFLSMNYEQKRGFIEGLTAANEAENDFRTDKRHDTDATPLYLELLLYWPEINEMESLPEVFRLLETRFMDAPARLGSFERFRLAANRIKLSFKDHIPLALPTVSPSPPVERPPPG